MFRFAAVRPVEGSLVRMTNNLRRNGVGQPVVSRRIKATQGHSR